MVVDLKKNVKEDVSILEIIYFIAVTISVSSFLMSTLVLLTSYFGPSSAPKMLRLTAS